MGPNAPFEIHKDCIVTNTSIIDEETFYFFLFNMPRNQRTSELGLEIGPCNAHLRFWEVTYIWFFTSSYMMLPPQNSSHSYPLAPFLLVYHYNYY